ncbi:BNR-4 repeat-containing protein [Methylotuvimicrobium sp.]|uniref:BNR-4 repeat-containing protein n=1 Tax=Methylotuvimicrobium sp. TaxID=2822413 RepID=UPI003D66022A
MKNTNKNYLFQESINTNIVRRLIVFLFLTYSLVGYCAQVEDILSPIKVSKSNISTWATPIAYRDGQVFIVTVEQPDNVLNGINLKTVIRKGEKSSEGWKWDSFVVDSETLDDQWHNVPSLAIDANGYIHVAYNMHNMPWQYVVSSKPLNINGFEFRGQTVSSVVKYAVKHLNRTPFPGIGQAAIPGNQITYPAFFQDKNNDLYVTYRFAVRPKKHYLKRGFGAGIAKYNNETKSWDSLGGDFSLSNIDALLNSDRSIVKPFALTFDWWAYFPRLAFDSGNQIHVAWMWRQGRAGGDLSHPSYAWSANNGQAFKTVDSKDYELPITVNMADQIGSFSPGTKFYGPTRIAIGPDDTPYFLLQPIGQARVLVYYDKTKNHWSKPEKLPNSALEIAFDTNGNLWAFATGLRIFKRNGIHGVWRMIHEDKEAKIKSKHNMWCHPKVALVPESKVFLIYTQSCDYTRLKVTKVDWE